jgi:uncharacterized protein
MAARAGSFQETIDELVARIVAAVAPSRIVLFGSAARGELGADSDLDVLVVMPDGIHRRGTSQAIYLCLAGLGTAKDIVVVTESDVAEHGDDPSLVLCPALREGRVVYAAEA